MTEGRVESTRHPRNPLDVLAQQVVAMTSVEPWGVDALHAAVRGAAPFADLSRTVFENVLDLLSGRFASDDFAELRPRVTWDRVANTVIAREGAKRIAIVNGGTIPDRGLYGVFLAGGEKAHARVGELDEEMVFESKVGEVFLLGASSWRIEEITHDRVLVSPAPGQPGKMPFWHGDAAARPLETGQLIGQLVRELREVPARRGGVAAGPRPPARAPGGGESAPVPRGPGRGRPVTSPTTGRWWWSGPATSWATGGCASSRRSGAACTRRGRWR